MTNYEYTLQRVVDNMLCAIEMFDPKPTKGRLLGLKGPTRGENTEALELLLNTGQIFEEGGYYYISQKGLERFLDITEGVRLSSGSEGEERIRRN